MMPPDVKTWTCKHGTRVGEGKGDQAWSCQWKADHYRRDTGKEFAVGVEKRQHERLEAVAVARRLARSGSWNGPTKVMLGLSGKRARRASHGRDWTAAGPRARTSSTETCRATSC